MINDLFPIRSEKAILLGKVLIVELFQRFEIFLNALVILRVLWFVELVYGRCVEHDQFLLKQDEDMSDTVVDSSRSM
jgi:hypothetical protein